MKFFIKDFFSKCDQIRNFLRIWSSLLKKSLIENFIFCAVCFSELLLRLFTTSMGRYQKINKIFYICLSLSVYSWLLWQLFIRKIFKKYYSKMVILLYRPCPPFLFSIKADWWVEAAIKRCSCKNVFWKFAADLQENTLAEVRFQ